MAKVIFDTPITRGADEIKEIELREPKGGELRGLSLTDLARGEVDALMVLAPRITSPFLTKSDLETMTAPDLAEIMRVVRDFFEPKNKAA